MEKITSWLRNRFLSEETDPQDLDNTGSVRVTRNEPQRAKRHEPEPALVEVDPEIHGSIESNGPGKNVLIRNRFVREETGTHETLKIVDDSMIDTGEEPGLDPYNTGGFDRSKKWDQRFRK
ncbi:MAG: hypothetical protein ACR2QZ_09940 [Woeseiaceae bacterium]